MYPPAINLVPKSWATLPGQDDLYPEERALRILASLSSHIISGQRDSRLSMDSLPQRVFTQGHPFILQTILFILGTHQALGQALGHSNEPYRLAELTVGETDTHQIITHTSHRKV